MENTKIRKFYLILKQERTFFKRQANDEPTDEGRSMSFILREMKGSERWLNSKEHALLFQETRVHPPAPMLGSLQPSL